jgi:FAD synthase
VPAYGIYAGRPSDHRAAISIGTNPHYGGEERRIEPYLLDFEGDLYGSGSSSSCGSGCATSRCSRASRS